ncbi:hypothetical protein Vretimale_62 [Volvox reticuliferus]|uniref:Retroviral polymerase SH3-like domain-containing protein n=1 Tax=Volvox reticuliferus TaxID=1737510 RepID=A0A8J4FJL3_9CHLO|nr:hypothetical protein Vretifemale_8438 [Volvox reticuliferus]GIL93753.1 hypothetical protein Vretimale_62 [Volvox reticuliferus]
MHILKEKRNKLQPVSRKGKLVGYDQGGQYRILFDEETVANHSAVKFDESTVGGGSIALGDEEDESADDQEEAANGAGTVPPSGADGGTPNSSDMDFEMTDNNSGPSTIMPSRGQGNMPPAQFPRTHNAEQSRGGGGNGGGQASKSGGNMAPSANNNIGGGYADVEMQDRRYPLHERKRLLIEWQQHPNGRVSYGRINAAISGDMPDMELKDSSDYRTLVGELNYLATSTRPDIAQALSVLARFMGKPSKSHMWLALGVLRYLAGTRELGLCFGGAGEFALEGYSDSDWAGDPATRRSTTGYVFKL